MAAPVLTVTPIAAVTVDDVQVDYLLSDADSDPCTMAFEYSLNGGGSWLACTESSDPLSEGFGPLATTPAPTPHVFVWDANTDLGLVTANILLRASADDGGTVVPVTVGPFAHYCSVLAGPPYSWPGVFAANNDPPSGMFFFPPPYMNPPLIPIAVQSGTVLAQYRLYDEQSDPIDVEFQFSRNNGLTWETCQQGTGGDGLKGLASLPLALGGVGHTFAWDTTPVRSARVRLRAKPRDEFASGAWFSSDFVWIENQGAFWWVPRQIAPAVFEFDPDGVLRYWADLVEAWRVREAEDILGFEKLFSADECPQEFLPNLAAQIGLRIDQNFPEVVRRRQINQALLWYKAKGLEQSFVDRFSALGYYAKIVELWTDGFDCADHSLGPDWMPHSRIDLILAQFDPETPIPATDFVALAKHVEEVRPIHVLLRRIIPGIFAAEEFASADDEDGKCQLAYWPLSESSPLYLFDAGPVVDKGGGFVGLPMTNHNFLAGEVVEIVGTINYDGTYTVDAATTVNEVVVAATYAAETLRGNETAMRVVTVPPTTQHVWNDRIDQPSWRAHPGPLFTMFNGTRPEITIHEFRTRYFDVGASAVDGPAETLAAGPAVEFFGGKVALPMIANRFTAGTTVVLFGTANYDGAYVLQSGTTASRLMIQHAYTPEVFAGFEWVQQTIGPYVGTVGLPVANHGFVPGESVVVVGTANYDGTYTVLPGSTGGMILVAATYAPEVFAGTETAANPAPTAPFFTWTMLGDIDAFSDQTLGLGVYPEIGPPHRELITLAALAAAGVVLGDASSWYDEDELTINVIP